MEKYTELSNKIKNLIKTKNSKTGDYDEKHMKIKFDSYNILPLNKMLKLCNLTIVVRSVFQEDGTYSPQNFLRWTFVWIINARVS